MQPKVIRFLLIIVSILILLSASAYLFIILPQKKSLEKVRKMQIETIDGTMVEDGVYRGNFEYTNTGVAVVVTVKNHKITQIEILKGGINAYGLRAESITDSVINANSTNVDVITGSTTTSKALLKAIENALKSGDSSTQEN